MLIIALIRARRYLRLARLTLLAHTCACESHLPTRDVHLIVPLTWMLQRLANVNVAGGKLLLAC